ncbi:MAG: DUF2089 domain-containing protein [Kosmotogaceae bacterium]|nr:DUF2089 domain-containing protein [Kosmotogaceae bacterium]
MKKRLAKCPSCGGDLKITEYTCQNCKTKIIGSFSQDELLSLPEELLDFLKVFIKNRGNLSELQKELNISYPTARSKLEELVTSLGFEVANRQVREASKIIKKLEEGELSAEEAVQLLNNMKKGK